MISDIQRLMEEYHAWLRDRTVLREVGDWVEITTPYLDRHNDFVQMYAHRENGGYILTDDGYTIDDLEDNGCKLDSPKRQDLLKMTLNGFGARLEGRALQVHATPATFASRKHNLIQAMLAVNDMFYLAVPMVASIFYEDVVAWLDLHDVRYTPKAKFTGKSGYDHVFDFVIPKSRTQPERIVQAMSNPKRDAALTVAFAWTDTKEVRSSDSRAYAFLNDSERAASSDVEEALRSYNVRPVPWSQREVVLPELAA